MSPAEDFADKCDRIMKELVKPAAPKPMPVWIDENLFAHFYAQVQVTSAVAAIISSRDIAVIKKVHWEPTGGDLRKLQSIAETKSKNPMASQQAWKKKHRR